MPEKESSAAAELLAPFGRPVDSSDPSPGAVTNQIVDDVALSAITSTKSRPSRPPRRTSRMSSSRSVAAATALDDDTYHSFSHSGHSSTGTNSVETEDQGAPRQKMKKIKSKRRLSSKIGDSEKTQQQQQQQNDEMEETGNTSKLLKKSKSKRRLSSRIGDNEKSQQQQLQQKSEMEDLGNTSKTMIKSKSKRRLSSRTGDSEKPQPQQQQHEPQQNSDMPDSANPSKHMIKSQSKRNLTSGDKHLEKSDDGEEPQPQEQQNHEVSIIRKRLQEVKQNLTALRVEHKDEQSKFQTKAIAVTHPETEKYEVWQSQEEQLQSQTKVLQELRTLLASLSPENDSMSLNDMDLQPKVEALVEEIRDLRQERDQLVESSESWIHSNDQMAQTLKDCFDTYTQVLQGTPISTNLSPNFDTDEPKDGVESLEANQNKLLNLFLEEQHDFLRPALEQWKDAYRERLNQEVQLQAEQLESMGSNYQAKLDAATERHDAELKEVKNQLNLEKQMIQDSKDAHLEKYEKLEQELQKSKEALCDVERQSEESAERFASLQVELSVERMNRKADQDRLVNLRSQVETLAEEKEELMSAETGVRDALTEALAEANSNTARVQAELDSREQETSGRINELEQSMEAMKTANEDYKTKLVAYQTQIADTARLQAELDSREQETSGHINELEQSMETMKTTNEDCKTKLAAYQTQIDDLKACIGELEQKNKTLNEEAEQAAVIRDELELTVDDLEKELEFSQEENMKAQDIEQSLQEEVDRLVEECENLQFLNEELEEKMQVEGGQGGSRSVSKSVAEIEKMLVLQQENEELKEEQTKFRIMSETWKEQEKLTEETLKRLELDLEHSETEAEKREEKLQQEIMNQRISLDALFEDLCTSRDKVDKLQQYLKQLGYSLKGAGLNQASSNEQHQQSAVDHSPPGAYKTGESTSSTPHSNSDTSVSWLMGGMLSLKPWGSEQPSDDVLVHQIRELADKNAQLQSTLVKEQAKHRSEIHASEKLIEQLRAEKEAISLQLTNQSANSTLAE